MLHRSTSGPLRGIINTDSLLLHLSQKDKTIKILQKQFQRLTGLKQNYERLKDRKMQLLQKCQSINHQLLTNRDAQQLHQDTTQKRLLDLKLLLTSLQTQFQAKQTILTDLQTQSQLIYKTSSQKQNSLFLSNTSLNNLHSNIQSLLMQKQRISKHISQLKQLIQKNKYNHYQLHTSIQKYKTQLHNKQLILHKFTFQQSTLSQLLATFQQQNNNLDSNIQHIIQNISNINLSIKSIKQQQQEIMLSIKTKQLQKGRISTQYASKLKHYKLQKQKQKSIKSQTSAQKLQSSRITSLLKQLTSQQDYLSTQNTQISTINTQLSHDLQVCKTHLQNVNKINTRIKLFLQSFNKTNGKACKMLTIKGSQQKEIYTTKDFQNMGTGEGFDKSF